MNLDDKGMRATCPQCKTAIGKAPRYLGDAWRKTKENARKNPGESMQAATQPGPLLQGHLDYYRCRGTPHCYEARIASLGDL
jgi:hypothetical protein